MKNKLTASFLSLAVSGLVYAAPADLESLKLSDSVIADVTALASVEEEDFLSSFKSLLVKDGVTTELVAQYVEAAIVALPEKSRLIYITAMAVAPDAHDAIMAVYYERVANAGEGVSHSKGGLGPKGVYEAKGGNDNQVLNQVGGDIMSFPAGDILGLTNTPGFRLPVGSVANALLSSPLGSVGAIPISGGEPNLPGNEGRTTPATHISGTPEEVPATTAVVVTTADPVTAL